MKISKNPRSTPYMLPKSMDAKLFQRTGVPYVTQGTKMTTARSAGANIRADAAHAVSPEIAQP